MREAVWESAFMESLNVHRERGAIYTILCCYIFVPKPNVFLTPSCHSLIKGWSQRRQSQTLLKAHSKRKRGNSLRSQETKFCWDIRKMKSQWRQCSTGRVHRCKIRHLHCCESSPVTVPQQRFWSLGPDFLRGSKHQLFPLKSIILLLWGN